MARHGLIVVVIVLFFAAPGAPQRQTGGDTPTIAEKTAGTQKLEGFFNLYWEEKAERMWLEIINRQMLSPAGEIIRRIADESMRNSLSVPASGRMGARIGAERC